MNTNATTRIDLLARLRRRQESLARQAFLQAHLEAEASRKTLEQLQDDLRRHTRIVNQAMAGKNVAGCLDLYRRLVGGLRWQAAEESLRLEAAIERKRLCREQLVEAMTRRKACGHLMDKLTTAEQREQDHAASQELEALFAAQGRASAAEPAACGGEL